LFTCIVVASPKFYNKLERAVCRLPTNIFEWSLVER
jgi:hypothetical protein